MARTKTKKDVEFKLYAPDAKKVALAGDFNKWNNKSLSAKKSKDGFWRVNVSLPAGMYQYKFFVDGQWVNDPSCSNCVPNGFGSLNCTINLK